MQDTRKVFESRFVPKPEKDRLDRELQNKELANLVHFYVERSRRYGLLADSPVGDDDHKVAAQLGEILRPDVPKFDLTKMQTQGTQ
jgi:hypothetical protein